MELRGSRGGVFLNFKDTSRTMCIEIDEKLLWSFAAKIRANRRMPTPQVSSSSVAKDLALHFAGSFAVVWVTGILGTVVVI